MAERMEFQKKEVALQRQHPVRTGQDAHLSAQRSRQAVAQHSLVNSIPNSIDHVLYLQRMVGNYATRQLVSQTLGTRIQRLPSPAMVEEVLGTPFKDKKLFGKTISQQSTYYKAVLNSLRNYNNFVHKQKVSAITLGGLLGHYNEVEAAAREYIAAKGKKKNSRYQRRVSYMQNLLEQVKSERATAILVANRHEKKIIPPNLIPTWHVALDSAQQSKTISDEDVEGQVGAGTNVLDKVNVNGKVGYFKENIDLIPNAQLLMNVMPSLGVEDFKAPLEGTGMEQKGSGVLLNLENVAAWAGITQDVQSLVEMSDVSKMQSAYTKFGAFQKGGINLARRDIAMSRLDSLLGGGVIAYAEKAFRQTGQEGKLKEGSLMEEAKGHQPDDLTFGSQTTPTTVNIYDPDLQRLLSRLQLIDALAFQVDRNLSNFFIQTNDQGKVIAVTGIDNDMSFGQYALEIGKRFNFPGLSRFVDAELARTIIDLDSQMLQWALGDILSEREMEALMKRLGQLQGYLKELDSRKQLLEPDQWDEASAKGMLDENSSYYASMVKQFYKEQ